MVEIEIVDNVFWVENLLKKIFNGLQRNCTGGTEWFSMDLTHINWLKKFNNRTFDTQDFLEIISRLPVMTYSSTQCSSNCSKHIENNTPLLL